MANPPSSPWCNAKQVKQLVIHYIVQRRRQSIARCAPRLNIGQCKDRWNSRRWRRCFLMSGRIAPVVELTEVSDSKEVRGIDCERELEAESLEILSNVLNGRISGVELQLGAELRLHGWSETCGHCCCHANMRTFGVK